MDPVFVTGSIIPFTPHRLERKSNTHHQIHSVSKGIMANKQERSYMEDIHWYRLGRSETNTGEMVKQIKGINLQKKKGMSQCKIW